MAAQAGHSTFPYLAVAAMKYRSPHAGDLTFSKNETIRVLSIAEQEKETGDEDDDDDDDWLVGESLDGTRKGTFPAGFVKRIEGDAAPPPAPAAGHPEKTNADTPAPPAAEAETERSVEEQGQPQAALDAPSSEHPATEPLTAAPSQVPPVSPDAPPGELEGPTAEPAMASASSDVQADPTSATAEGSGSDSAIVSAATEEGSSTLPNVEAQTIPVPAPVADEPQLVEPKSKEPEPKEQEIKELDPKEPEPKEQESKELESKEPEPLKQEEPKPTSPPTDAKPKPPPPSKPNSLRDRIAAFNKPADAAPPPLPRGKPSGGGFVRRGFPGAAPSSVSADADSEDKKKESGMSAADARSAVKVGSLRDRIAALSRGQPKEDDEGDRKETSSTTAKERPPVPGKLSVERRGIAVGAIGLGASAPPKPARKASSDSRTSITADGGEAPPEGESATLSPSSHSQEAASPPSESSIEPTSLGSEGDTQDAGVGDTASQEQTEEEAEQARRAAIAKRMAALGGRRMGGPVFAPAPAPAPPRPPRAASTEAGKEDVSDERQASAAEGSTESGLSPSSASPESSSPASTGPLKPLPRRTAPPRRLRPSPSATEVKSADASTPKDEPVVAVEQTSSSEAFYDPASLGLLASGTPAVEDKEFPSEPPSRTPAAESVVEESVEASDPTDSKRGEVEVGGEGAAFRQEETPPVESTAHPDVKETKPLSSESGTAGVASELAPASSTEQVEPSSTADTVSPVTRATELTATHAHAEPVQPQRELSTDKSPIEDAPVAKPTKVNVPTPMPAADLGSGDEEKAEVKDTPAIPAGDETAPMAGTVTAGAESDGEAEEPVEPVEGPGHVHRDRSTMEESDAPSGATEEEDGAKDSIQAVAEPVEPAGVAAPDTSLSGKDPAQEVEVKEEQEQPQTEEMEAARRAAIAKRMAALGGQRMGGPLFGGHVPGKPRSKPAMAAATEAEQPSSPAGRPMAPASRSTSRDEDVTYGATTADPEDEPERRVPAEGVEEASPNEEESAHHPAPPSRRIPGLPAGAVPIFGLPAVPIPGMPSRTKSPPGAAQVESVQLDEDVELPSEDVAPAAPPRPSARPPAPAPKRSLPPVSPTGGENVRSTEDSKGIETAAVAPVAAPAPAPPSRRPPVPQGLYSQRASVASGGGRSRDVSVDDMDEGFEATDSSTGFGDTTAWTASPPSSPPPSRNLPARPNRPPPAAGQPQPFASPKDEPDELPHVEEHSVDIPPAVPDKSPASFGDPHAAQDVPVVPQSQQPSAPVAPAVDDPVAPPSGPPSADQLRQWSSFLAGDIVRSAQSLAQRPASDFFQETGPDAAMAFVLATLRSVPHVHPSAAQSLGVPVFEQVGPSVTNHTDEVRPGDVLLAFGADLKGKKGLAPYHQQFGTASTPQAGVVVENDGKKRKLRVLQSPQRAGGRHAHAAEEVSYRLDDLRSGVLKVFRVPPRAA